MQGWSSSIDTVFINLVTYIYIYIVSTRANKVVVVAVVVVAEWIFKFDKYTMANQGSPFKNRSFDNVSVGICFSFD